MNDETEKFFVTRDRGRPEHCQCGARLMSSSEWQRTRPSARKGFSLHRGHGLCTACHKRAERAARAKGPRPGINPPAASDAPRHQCAECREAVVSRHHWRRFGAEAFRAIGITKCHSRVRPTPLCEACYDRLDTAGRLELEKFQYHRSADETLDEWVLLRNNGCTDLKVAAARMGMTKGALEKALERARKRGDSRASRTPFAHDYQAA